MIDWLIFFQIMQGRNHFFQRLGGSPCVKQRVLTRFVMSASTPPEYCRLFAQKIFTKEVGRGVYGHPRTLLAPPLIA